MSPARMLLPVLVSGLACLLAVWLGARDAAPAAEDPGQGADRTTALAVLRSWDRARAAAWQAGDPVALAGLYADGAGLADRQLLAAYAGRGLRVAGMRMQVAAVEVVVAADDRVELVVTDRLVGATAVGRGVRVPLPHDRWSRRRVVLVRTGEVWRVSRVSDQPWPANTDPASGSANSNPAASSAAG